MKKGLKSLSRAVMVSGIITSALGSGAFGQLYTGWSNFQDYVMNSSATGITTNQVNFPVLLRLTSVNSAIFSNATSPNDLRFAKGSNLNVGYPYQVERWDATHQVAEIWVLVDTVFSASTSQDFRMYWGNASATSLSNGNVVFDTANGFVGVWHLGEAGNTSAGGYKDATLNAANGTGSNLSATNTVAAVIGNGQKLTHSSSSPQYITISNEPKFELTRAITVSGWINIATWNVNWQAIITKGEGNSWRVARNGTSGNLDFVCANTNIDGATTVKADGTTWYYITEVYDGSNMYEYLNGNTTPDASKAQTGSTGTNTTNVAIGENLGATGRGFSGIVNEMRVEKIARSADWIKLCYLNQQVGQTFITPIPVPAAPLLSSPTNNALNQALLLTLSWGTVSGATSYSVEISTSSAFGTTVFGQTGLSTISVIASGLANSTLYYWQVSATDLTEPSAWSGTWSFTTIIAAPGVPVLASPSSGSVSEPISPTLSWGTVTGTASYGILISSVSSFATTAASQTGITGVSTTVSGLTNGTSYYWEVNATNVGGTSAWSDTWSFTTIIAAPGVPVLASPSSGSINQPTSATMSWGAVTGAASYSIMVSSVANFATTAASQTGITGVSATISGLANGTPYYWEVNATNVGGTSSWSGAWSFTTVPFPAPVLNSPSNGSTNQPVSPSLVWSPVSGAASYSLQVSQNSAFSSTVFSQGGLTALSQTVGPLSYIMTYFWQVNAYDGTSQTTAWSSVWSFTTSLPLPGTPVLSSPTSGTIDLPASLTLTWGQANLATSYDLQISTSSTFATTFLSQSVSGASASVNNLALGTTYYWEVAGADINGQGSWSLIWSFTTATTAALANGDRAALKTDFVVKGDALLYSLASSGAVEITFSDLLGRTALAVNRTQPAGRYAIALKNSNLSTGRYIVRFKAAGIEKKASIVITR